MSVKKGGVLGALAAVAAFTSACTPHNTPQFMQNQPYFSTKDLNTIIDEAEKEIGIELSKEQREAFVCFGKGFLVGDKLALNDLEKEFDEFLAKNSMELDTMTEDQAFDFGQKIGEVISSYMSENGVFERMEARVGECGVDELEIDSLNAQLTTKMDSFTPNF